MFDSFHWFLRKLRSNGGPAFPKLINFHKNFQTLPHPLFLERKNAAIFLGKRAFPRVETDFLCSEEFFTFTFNLFLVLSRILFTTSEVKYPRSALHVCMITIVGGHFSQSRFDKKWRQFDNADCLSLLENYVDCSDISQHGVIANSSNPRVQAFWHST